MAPSKVLVRTLALLVLAAMAGAAAPSAQRASLIAGVDHVPVAVRDLERARQTYERLGFVLKPGAPHANGIQNLHAKFRNGTEIELITAKNAVDELTRTYVTHLKDGDGPAFLALHAPDGAAVARVIPRDHPARRYIFFGGLNHSPTDRPEHFQHPNTAESLVSVWLADDGFRDERDLLRRVGVMPVKEKVRVPEDSDAVVAHLDATTLVLLPRNRQIVRGRRIIGATVTVKSVDTAGRILRDNGVPFTLAAATAGTRSLFVAPEFACGWTLEFQETAR